MFSEWKMHREIEEKLYAALVEALDNGPRSWQHSGKDTSRGRGLGCELSGQEARYVDQALKDAARDVVKIQKSINQPVISAVIEAASELIVSSTRPSEVAASIRDAVKTLRENHAWNVEHLEKQRAQNAIDAQAEALRHADEMTQFFLNQHVMPLNVE